MASNDPSADNASRNVPQPGAAGDAPAPLAVESSLAASNSSAQSLGPNAPGRSFFARPEIASLLRYFYVSNPFYVISALLVIVGLMSLFHDEGATLDPGEISFNNWMLLQLIGGYTLLLAVSACLMVRWGHVWDDARTILLTLVILFVAMSVSFDKLVLTKAVTVSGLLGTGLAFSVVVSEGVLRGMRVRLSLLYRGPYYLALALFFLYPALMNYFLNTIGEQNYYKGRDLTMWGALLFPSAAALVTLSLLPAAWRGPRLTANNGTPWAWPWFPWSLFLFLGIAVVFRTFYLTVSFHAHWGTESGMGIYFLVPFLLAVCVLLFEIGRPLKHTWLETFLVTAPLALLPLSLPGTETSESYADYLQLYMARAGAPIVMTSCGLALLYLYAALRGVRRAEIALAAVLVLGAFLGPQTLDLKTLSAPRALPLALAVIPCFIHAVRRPAASARWLAVAATTLGSLTVTLQGTAFLSYGGFVPIHLGLAGILVLGACFQDPFADVLRKIGGVTLILLSFGAVVSTFNPEFAIDSGISSGMVTPYVLGLALVSWGIWYVLRGSDQRLVAWVVTGCLMWQLSLISAGKAKQIHNPRGVLLVLGGIASFLIAAAISLLKARGRRVIVHPPEGNSG